MLCQELLYPLLTVGDVMSRVIISITGRGVMLCQELLYPLLAVSDVMSKVVTAITGHG